MSCQTFKFRHACLREYILFGLISSFSCKMLFYCDWRLLAKALNALEEVTVCIDEPSLEDEGGHASAVTSNYSQTGH